MIFNLFCIASQVLVNLNLNDLVNPLYNLFLILCLALYNLKNYSIPSLIYVRHQLSYYLFFVR